MKDSYDLSNLKRGTSKKRTNSRTKGNTFERKIAKILNGVFETKEFSRSPGSGAFATTHTLPDHLKIHGDLITPENFRFCIECKKGYNKENITSLFNYNSDIWKFINQCERDSIKANKVPMVIYQQDRQKTLCILPKGVFPDHINHILIKDIRSIAVKYYCIYLLDNLIAKEVSKLYWFS